jgi:putative transposase
MTACATAEKRTRQDCWPPYVKSAELSRLRITQAKHTEERAWLADVSAVVLQQSLRDLDTAYKNFFDPVKGKRQGRKAGPPRYKSKKDTRQSIRLNTNAFSLPDDGTVYVAKVGNLKVTWSRRLPAAPTSLTVTKDSSGRYFLSFVVDSEPDILPGLETEAGIDLGLSAFAVLSDGRKIDSPRFLRRAEEKLKRLQRELCRSQLPDLLGWVRVGGQHLASSCFAALLRVAGALPLAPPRRGLRSRR